VGALVGFFVVGDVIDLILLEEGVVDDPRGIVDDLVDPAAVAGGFAALGMGHDGAALVLLAELVGADADEEVDLRKGELGLAELEGVPVVG
jgi:hypothetical protein